MCKDFTGRNAGERENGKEGRRLGQLSDCNANLTPIEGLGVRLAGSVLDCYGEKQVCWTIPTAPSCWHEQPVEGVGSISV